MFIQHGLWKKMILKMLIIFQYYEKDEDDIECNRSFFSVVIQ